MRFNTWQYAVVRENVDPRVHPGEVARPQRQEDEREKRLARTSRSDLGDEKANGRAITASVTVTNTAMITVRKMMVPYTDWVKICEKLDHVH